MVMLKLIKDAGALVSHPFGSVMRSILIAVYELQAQEVLVIAHYDCGMSGLKAEPVIESMKKRGIYRGNHQYTYIFRNKY